MAKELEQRIQKLVLEELKKINNNKIKDLASFLNTKDKNNLAKFKKIEASLITAEKLTKAQTIKLKNTQAKIKTLEIKAKTAIELNSKSLEYIKSLSNTSKKDITKKKGSSKVTSARTLSNFSSGSIIPKRLGSDDFRDGKAKISKKLGSDSFIKTRELVRSKFSQSLISGTVTTLKASLISKLDKNNPKYKKKLNDISKLNFRDIRTNRAKLKAFTKELKSNVKIGLDLIKNDRKVIKNASKLIDASIKKAEARKTEIQKKANNQAFASDKDNKIKSIKAKGTTRLKNLQEYKRLQTKLTEASTSKSTNVAKVIKEIDKSTILSSKGKEDIKNGKVTPEEVNRRLKVAEQSVKDAKDAKAKTDANDYLKIIQEYKRLQTKLTEAKKVDAKTTKQDKEPNFNITQKKITEQKDKLAKLKGKKLTNEASNKDNTDVNKEINDTKARIKKLQTKLTEAKKASTSVNAEAEKVKGEIKKSKLNPKLKDKLINNKITSDEIDKKIKATEAKITKKVKDTKVGFTGENKSENVALNKKQQAEVTQLSKEIKEAKGIQTDIKKKSKKALNDFKNAKSAFDNFNKGINVNIVSRMLRRAERVQRINDKTSADSFAKQSVLKFESTLDKRGTSALDTTTTVEARLKALEIFKQQFEKMAQ